MATSLIFEEQFEIPMNIGSLAEFRRWATSSAFPKKGRVDFIGGNIEVDISPEDLFVHGTVKTGIVAVLSHHIKGLDAGYLFTDATRVSSMQGSVSAEPDVVFVSHDAIDSGRVQLVPKATGGEDRYIEIDGEPDVVVEIVSDSSARKDTERLPVAYFAAGVREFWLVDARCDPLVFAIHGRGASAFEPVSLDRNGYQRSEVFGANCRLQRRRDTHGRPAYDLLLSSQL